MALQRVVRAATSVAVFAARVAFFVVRSAVQVEPFGAQHAAEAEAWPALHSCYTAAFRVVPNYPCSLAVVALPVRYAAAAMLPACAR